MIAVPSLVSAFIAGLVTFIAPCTLPLVPAYLGVLTGAGVGEARQSRRRMLRAAFLFVLGFSVVFVLLGSLAGLVGVAAAPVRLVIQRVGGVLIIVLGLSMLGVLRLPLLRRSFQARLPGLGRLPRSLRAFLFGVVLASGWTPCVGPILGTILLLGTFQQTVSQGALLLGVYSVGLAIPFLLVALFYGQATKLIARAGRVARGIEIAAGLFLVFLGVLFVTDRQTAFISGAYRLLNFINYDALYRFF